MTKRPAFQWYPGDARRDAALMSCPLVVRGLWREMVDLMHDGEPYGHLTAGGRAISADELARIVGEPAAKVRNWLAELEAKGVFSRTDAGVIYSRRMVRDEEVRAARAAGGSKGGNPALLGKDRPKPTPKDAPKDNREVGGKVNHRANLGPTPAFAVAVALEEHSSSTPIPPRSEHPAAPVPSERESATEGEQRRAVRPSPPAARPTPVVPRHLARMTAAELAACNDFKRIGEHYAAVAESRRARNGQHPAPDGGADA